MSPAGSGSPLKPNGCKDCSRAFATRLALRDHSASTGHGFVCTTRGCTRLFLSSIALEDHLKSPAHIKPAVPIVPAPKPTPAPTTSVRKDSAPTSNEKSQSNVQTFPCTKSGCTKKFKTSQSRAQHLNMASHGTKQTPHSTQTASATNTEPGDRPKTDTPDSRQNTGSDKPKALLGTAIGSQHAGTVKAVPQTHNSLEHVGKPVVAPKSARLNPPTIPKTQKHIPLSGLDTRWSIIPQKEYDCTMNALIAAIPGPENWYVTGVDKEFWTPDLTSAPSYQKNTCKRRAIVLDCEMVGIGPKGTISELARLSAIDFLTGELLIDTLVEPLCPITDLRTKWSGITAERMKAAVASGKALKGSTVARTELFKCMDSETILIGHSIQYDLAALGIVHWLTVDSASLAEKAVGKKVKRRWGLKVMCKELLRIDVQDHGDNGHDSVEDTLAARELVLWCLSHKKELKAWGKKKKEEYYSAPGKTKSRSQMKKPKKKIDMVISGYDPDEYECLCLSVRELNELCHYPEWYDNWSD